MPTWNYLKGFCNKRVCNKKEECLSLYRRLELRLRTETAAIPYDFNCPALLLYSKGQESGMFTWMYLIGTTMQGTMEELEDALGSSKTLYVGNLSFFTTEEQIYQLFSKVGEVKRIIMGLDRMKKTPCGFCFVEYYSREDALDCMKFLNGTKLDERVIRTDIDPGFVTGRQFGRGRSGGQVRDEHRDDFDQGRGGWGQKSLQQQGFDEKRARTSRETYASNEIPEGAASSFYYAPPAGGYRYRSNKRGRGRDEYEEDVEDNGEDLRTRLGGGQYSRARRDPSTPAGGGNPDGWS